ncbi:MAG: peptide chain release factor N(5)-glutamine methyltransferase [Thermoanaerobaculia bacterium]
MTTVASLLAEAKERLLAAPFRPPPREAHLLLGRVLGLDEARLLARDHETVPPPAEAAFRELLARRLAGEPVAYLLGEREFYGRPFRVDRRVLVPRPETEHLVEAALDSGLGLPAGARVLDVGTGSGAIAVTLALERPSWRVAATDLSPAALAVARENARRHGLLDPSRAPRRLTLLACDLASALRLEAFDLVVSNPPYIDPAEAAALSPEILEFEPPGALFDPASGGGASSVPGTGIACRLVASCRTLPSRAALALEIGEGQLPVLRDLALRYGWRLHRLVDDYAGIPRVVVLTRR